MHKLIVFIEETIDVYLDDLQGMVAEKAMCLKNSPLSCMQPCPILIADEVAQLEYICHIGPHAISQR